MDYSFLRKCINQEVDHWTCSGKTSLIRRLWYRYFQCESNAVFLIRLFQYHSGKAGLYHNIRSRFLGIKLMRRYGIYIGRRCIIDIGFKIWHAHGIIINNVTIGKNFNVNQNCTIGDKKHGLGQYPVIGNNVTMYANSTIIGNVIVEDDVTLGANACLVENTNGPGVYVGVPAKRLASQ